MSRTSRWVTGFAAFVAASALSFGTPASAQGPGGGAPPGVAADATSGLNIDVAALVKAKAGAWADYTMAGGKGASMTVRYALVERTPQKMTLEVTSSTPRGDMVMHLEFMPAGGDAWKVMVGKIQLGDQKMELPVEKLAGAAPLRPGDSLGTLVGSEKLTTAAGDFPCKHYTRAMPTPAQANVPAGQKPPVLELWMNENVSPTGLVKSTLDAAGVTMTLAGTGTGAKSQLH